MKFFHFLVWLIMNSQECRENILITNYWCTDITYQEIYKEALERKKNYYNFFHNFRQLEDKIWFWTFITFWRMLSKKIQSVNWIRYLLFPGRKLSAGIYQKASALFILILMIYTVYNILNLIKFFHKNGQNILKCPQMI